MADRESSNDSEQNYLRTGSAISYVRNNLYNNGKGFKTVYEFYDKCDEIYKKDFFGSDCSFVNPGHPKPLSKETASKRISRLESRGDVGDYDRVIISRVFKLPDTFFDRRFLSIDELTREYHLKAGRRGVKTKRAVGFRQINHDEPISAHRLAMASKLMDVLWENGAIKTSLILVEGPFGCGKEFFVRHWARDHALKIFGENSIFIDCVNNDPSPIAAKLESFFGGAFADQTIIDRLNENQGNLIIINGFYIEDFAGKHRTFGHHRAALASLQAVSELVQKIINNCNNTVVVVILENNFSLLDKRIFTSFVDSYVANVQTLSLDYFSDEDGSEFLLKIGVDDLDASTRRSLSRKLFGYPVLLSSFAREAKSGVFGNLQGYISAILNDQIPEGLNWRDTAFESLLNSYLDRADKIAPSTNQDVHEVDPHPRALFRLLSLMYGPIFSKELEVIISLKRIRRLKNFDIKALGNGIPFLRIEDDKIDINIYARHFLRKEVYNLISADNMDKTTSVDEVFWIHRTRIDLYRDKINHVEPNDPELIDYIEQFVYHFSTVIRVFSDWGMSANAKKSHNITKDYFEKIKTLEDFRSFSPHKIWTLGYEQIIKPYLIDKGKSKREILGEYDKKSRILSEFSSMINRDWEPRSPFFLAEFFKEIALCLMHSGQLQAAENALQRCFDYLHRCVPDADDGQNGWRVQCDVKSLKVALHTRLGRNLELFDEDFQGYVEQADQIAQDYLGSTEKRSSTTQIPHPVSAAIRILTRKADLLLYGGELEEAKAYFERAISLHTISGRSAILAGEAARRYVVCLVRSRNHDPHALDLAEDIVGGNIKSLSGYNDGRGPTSVDLIPFMVLRAGLLRIRGDLSEAAKMLSRVEAHPYVLRKQCTFLALSELRMEKIRLNLAGSSEYSDRSEIKTAADFLASHLANNHHATMQHDAELLGIEAVNPNDRHVFTKGAMGKIISIGYYLRRGDIKELENGASASRIFGL